MFTVKPIVLSGAALLALTAAAVEQSQRKTEVAIQGQAFHLNGRPTYEGRSYNGMKLEGLLMNARLVQATFDFRMKGEGFDDGYQSVPVNWGISSARKRGFFGLLRRMTAEPGENML
jgi:hypothetical protein